MKKPFNQFIKVALAAGCCYLSTTFSAEAQNRVRAGVKGGFNASTLNINAGENRNERYGFHAGVFAQIPAGEFFAIQPELLYSTKGASAEYNIVGAARGRNTFRLNYAELPVLATFKLGNAVELQAGPYAAYLINANVGTEGSLGSGTTALNADQFNRFDYGLAGGLNIYFGKAFIGLRYGQGLQRIANSDLSRTLLGNARNTVGQVSLGFSLN